MMITLLTFAILAGSVLLVVGNLRMVAADTVSALAGCVLRARRLNQLHNRLAFVALWLLLFALCYGA
jgi:hypothetical protein